jgi:predicted permease
MAFGITFNLLRLELPDAIDRWAMMMAGAAVPCALFSVGASLRAYRIAGALKPAAMIVALKLVVHPLAVWVLATLVFDVPPLWAKVVILLAALPVGVNVYVFATRYDAGQAESAAAILISSILSVVTLPIILYWLGAG